MGYGYDYCGIYKIENLINGKVYIGQSKTIRSRWNDHKKVLKKGTHRNIHLQKAWNKYGEENFSHDILELCSENELNEKEIFWIKQFNAFNKEHGYNLTSGGDCDRQVSNETRLKLIKNGKKTGMMNAKKVICLETREVFDTIISAANKYNMSYSAITRVCDHTRNTAKGLHWLFYDEYIQLTEEKIHHYLSSPPNRKEKTIIYINTNQIYNSIQEASQDTGINANSISQCCLGNRKSAGHDEYGNPRIFKYHNKENIV